MDKLKSLLEALDPGPIEVLPDPEEERVLSNVMHLRFPPKGDRGELFSRDERAKIRDMLEAFEKIRTACPIAARLSEKP